MIDRVLSLLGSECPVVREVRKVRGVREVLFVRFLGFGRFVKSGSCRT